MKEKVYTLYKELSDDQRTLLGVVLRPSELYYEDENSETIMLELNPVSTGFTVKEASWDYAKNQVTLYQQIEIKNSGLKNLFKGTEQITNMKSELGLAVEWSVSGSGVRGCSPIDEKISYNAIGQEDVKCISFELAFEPGMLKGDLEYTVFFYMKKYAGALENGLADAPGTRLGYLHKPIKIHFSGEASSFPIENVDLAGGPLWYVDYHSTEPENDMFDCEHICLVINQAHQDYGKLTRGNAATPLFYECLASGLAEMFKLVLKDDATAADFASTEASEMTDGSIFQALKYMQETFDIKLIRESSYLEFHKSIRRMVERLREGGQL